MTPSSPPPPSKRQLPQQDDAEVGKARTSSLKRSISRRSSSSSRLSLLSKKVEKILTPFQTQINTLQDDSEVCITDAQSLDRLSLQSQEELEEVNLERYLQVVSAVIMSSSFFTTRPSSPLWSSPLSQPGCRPRSKLVEGLWLSARWSHRSSEVHRLPTAGVQVQIFALGLRLLLLFCVLPLCTSFFIII